VAENLGMLGSALPDLMSPNQAREESSPRPLGSLLVEAELVGDRGSFAAAGGPELGQNPRDVDACGALGDEQLLTDPSVGPSLGHQREHFGLAPGQAQRRGRGRRLGRSGRVDVVFEVEAATLGEQLDLAAQRRCVERQRRLVGAAERLLGLRAGRAVDQ
jgi:hypothetical protein